MNWQPAAERCQTSNRQGALGRDQPSTWSLLEVNERRVARERDTGVGAVLQVRLHAMFWNTGHLVSGRTIRSAILRY